MPTPQEIRTFMKPARVLAVEFLQILDGSNQCPDPDNAVIVAAAGQAFAQAQAYLQRPFFGGTYCHRWFAVNREIILPVVPVQSVTEVKADDAILTAPDDYELVGNRIQFAGGVHAGSTSGAGSFVRGTDVLDQDFLYRVVDVTYVGGYSRSDDDANFNNAMAEQISAQYRRAPFIGLSAAAGGQNLGSVTVGSDRGSLIEGVALQLDPLVYYGEAEELRCP